jgi:hypothetical protein
MISLQIPLGLKPTDLSPSAERARYAYLTDMQFLTGGRGFRMAGTKRGITKPPFARNRIERMTTTILKKG